MAKRFGFFKEIAIGGSIGVAVLALFLGATALTGVPTPSSSPTETATPTQTPTTTPTPTLSPTGEPCSVSKQASNADLANLQALVVDAKTMTVLYDKNGQKASETASAVKLLTAAVALETLGADYTVTTRVYQDSADPSVIYFVGAGDPTLSRVSKSVYKNAAKLSDLAAQIKTALGDVQVSKVVVDSSLFQGGDWLDVWPKSERSDGYHSIATALEVDGDRNDPTKGTSKRSNEPDIRAGKWLVSALGEQASAATVERGTMPAGTKEVASVKSQPISRWISYMLQTSDNTLSEYLARLVSVAQGKNGNYATMDAVYKKSLSALGLDTAGMKIVDGSGQATNNAVSPAFMIQLVKQISDRANGFGVIDSALPVSGKSGSLAWRYKGSNKVAVGAVHAKTGWILRGYTLVGYVDAADGNRLLFAVYALGRVNSNTPTAIDTLVTGFYKCGQALTDQ